MANKKSKVKKTSVKEFPINKDAKKKSNVKAQDSALERQKQRLDNKRKLYIVYTVFCFIIVLAFAALVGYYGANAVAAQAQKMLTYKSVNTQNVNMSLANSPMYAGWWYSIPLYFGALILLLLITGKDRLYHLIGFGLGFGGAMFLTFYLTIRGLAGFALYFEDFRYLFALGGCIGVCLPFALGIIVLVIKILRYNYLVKKGMIREDDDYMPYEPLSSENN